MFHLYLLTYSPTHQCEYCYFKNVEAETAFYSIAMTTHHSSLSKPAAQSDEDRWDRVARAIDALSEAWEAHFSQGAAEPRLAEFLPSEDEQFVKLVLPELVKLDLEYRWQYGRSPLRVEEYAAEFPVLGTSVELPVDLIHEELQVRMQAGDRVTEEEIRERFPEQATSLCALVGGMAVSGSPTCTYYGSTVRSDALKGKGEGPSQLEEIPLRFEAGQTVDDFQLLTELGSGAFAQVFLARQMSMERLVALKISKHTGSEPQTLAQLDHQYVVRVFDQRASTSPPARLLYMEVIPGGTVFDVVKRVRSTPQKQRTGQLLLDVVDEHLGSSGTARPDGSSHRHWLEETSWPLVVARLGAQLAEGLGYAHSRGVLHRDIKPANVLLSPEGLPKLADFNVSYNGGRADEDPAEAFGGSLAYMSPEQLQACHPVLGGSPQLVRGQSDVYSLGVMLWELLVGTRPFDDGPSDGGSLAHIQRMIDRRHYADFNAMRQALPSDCPESLRKVLMKCLASRKEERYQTADEVARELRLCLEPRCWKLLQEPRSAIVKLMLALPIPTVVIAGLLPNALAGRFNLLYNRSRITPDLSEWFETVQLWINGIVFPLGVLVGVWVVRKIARQLDRTKPQLSAEGGKQVLFFGWFVSLLTLGMWSVSGLVFPLVMNMGGEIEGVVGFYSHFFMSLALCGISAAVFPYFILTALAVRVYFPAIVRNGLVAGPRWRDLQKLKKLNLIHLALSALVPMLGILLVTASGGDDSRRWALMVVSGVGIIGFAAMFILERYIDSNIAALEKIAIETPRGV
ncbi:serine/threonine-protein kinase [Bythopirellula goksoeyrii]|uniref:Serine/threonine-protein kinase PrkC n=1 Tax=Bythopirellula goksoeyrii TaxID=1400387 RepID=A0A5B9QE55_9BACT|nr:serine/threonine-protein kinase [Bythopirellula goksoeyrii]QEG37278.1 Serine/threonine-protein kinase PrkC [Bythopirellula goksoeyrii]